MRGASLMIVFLSVLFLIVFFSSGKNKPTHKNPPSKANPMSKEVPLETQPKKIEAMKATADAKTEQNSVVQKEPVISLLENPESTIKEPVKKSPSDQVAPKALPGMSPTAAQGPPPDDLPPIPAISPVLPYPDGIPSNMPPGLSASNAVGAPPSDRAPIAPIAAPPVFKDGKPPETLPTQ